MLPFIFLISTIYITTHKMADKIFPSLQLTGGTECAPGLTPDLFVYGGAKIKKGLCAHDLKVKTEITTQDINVTGTLMVNGQPITPTAIPPYIETASLSPVVLTAAQTVGLTFVSTAFGSSVTLQFPSAAQLVALIGYVQYSQFDVWCTTTQFGTINYDFVTQGGGYTLNNFPAFPGGGSQRTQLLRFVLTTASPALPNFSVYVK